MITPDLFNQITFRCARLLLLLTAVTIFLVACDGDTDGSSSATETQLDSAVEITESNDHISSSIPTPEPTTAPRIALMDEMLLLATQANDFYIHGDMTNWRETVNEFVSVGEEWDSISADLDTSNYALFGYEEEEDFLVQLGNIVLIEAYINYNNNNDEEALSIFNKVIDMSATQLSAAHSGRGHLYRLQDNLDKAVKDFRQAIVLDSENADAYRGLALIAYGNGDLKAANENIDYGLAINPEFGRIYMLQGDIAYYELGDTVSAETLYTQGIQYDPNYDFGYYVRARLYDKLGSDGKCVDDMDQAISLNPNDGWYYYQRGYCRVDLEQYAIALNDFDKAIPLESDSNFLANVHTGIGDAYFYLDDYTKAVDSYSTAIDFNSNKAITYRWRAHAYRGAEDYPNAINDYTYALSLDPSDRWAYYGMGISYDILNNYQEAYENYEKYLDMDSSDITETRYACERMNALHLYNSENLLDMFLGTACTRFPSDSNGSTASGGTGSADPCPYGVINGVCVQTLSECPWGPNGLGGCMSESEAGGLQLQDAQRNP